MSKKNSSVFFLMLNLAVGAMLAVGGIWALQGGGEVKFFLEMYDRL